jgi:hypothetical protein
MKRTPLFLTLLCAVFWFLPAKAERVNIEKAEQIARSYARTTPRLTARRNFRHSRTVSKPLHRHRPALRSATQGVAQQAAPQEEPLFHVFTMTDNGGFIIVSGDDVAKPVLGYADEGTYDESNPNLAYWMGTLAQEIAGAIENGVLQDAETKAAWDALHSSNTPLTASGDYIEPLVKTKWNQGAPYNNLCPNISGTRAVTGCVATAMAQIMKYHDHPTSRTTGIPGYKTQTNKISIPAITGATTYAWNNMTNTYTSSATGAPAQAVATLMYHCGVSVKMDYTADESGAYTSDVALALKNYFNYDAEIAYCRRNYYTYTAWINLLKTEIKANRPVFYAGYGDDGGHAFVCDGYNINDLFHFNWGWGGSSDGYFEISALNPGTLGIGGGSGGFNEDQEIITGIQPHQGGSGQPAIQLGLSTFSANKFSLNARTTPFDVTAEALTNTGIVPITNIYLGVLLCNQDDSYRSHKTSAQNIGLDPDYYYPTYTLLPDYSLPADLPVGAYKLYPAYSASAGAPSIIPGKNGNRYITVVVGADGKVTLTRDTVKPDLSLVSLKTVGNLYRNRTGNFEAEITNNGAVDYNSRLSIRLGSHTVVTDPVVIPAGTTKTAGFSEEITLTAGTYSLSVWYDPENVPGSTPSTQLGDAVSKEVRAEPTEKPNLSLVGAPSFQSGSAAVPINAPNLTVQIRNTGGVFINAIGVYIFPTNDDYSTGSFGEAGVSIEKNETISLLFNNPVDFLTTGTPYRGCVFYYDNEWKQLGGVFYFTVAPPSPPSSDATLKSLVADGLTPSFDPNVTHYTVILPCGTNSFAATATPTTGNTTVEYLVNGAPVTLPLSLKVPDTTTLVIRVTAQDGVTTQDYAIAVTRPFDSSIIRTYWNDVLAVNMNPNTNGGYVFTGFQWIKNGQPVTNETGPYLYFPTPMPDSDRYNVWLTTNNGQTLPVCHEIRRTSAATPQAGLLAYPNPARHIVTLENPQWESATQTDLINLSGQIVRTYPSARIQTVDVSGLPVGFYILRAGARIVNIIIE